MNQPKSIAIAEVLAYWSDVNGDDIALQHNDNSITWTEFEKSTNRLARIYADLGVEENDFVAIGLPNSIDFFESCFATWKLGATPLPISSRLPEIEREQIIELGKPSLVVGFESPVDLNDRKYVSMGYQHKTTFSNEPLPIKSAASWKAMTSGGSTGRPKLIIAKAPSDATFLERDYLKLLMQGSVLIPGPMYHNGPFLWGMLGLFKGNRITITDRFDAEETLRLIEMHQVDTVYMVPTMMHRIWNLSEEKKSAFNLKSLKTIWHLASPCPVWLKRKYIEWLGADVIWELYGGTEGTGFTTISGHEWLQHIGSVGKAKPDECEIKIFDDSGKELSANNIGEVFLRPALGPGTTYYYIGAESKVLGEGWESLGDMGYLDDDGYLYLTDRRTDMILSGGANIYPAEVEAAIDLCPGVRSSAVIGLPDDDLGNKIHAIVDTGNASVSEETLLNHLSNHLVRYKNPRTIEFVNKPVRDDAGKVRRSALRLERIKN